MRLNLRGKILVIATAAMLSAIGAVIATSAWLSARQYEEALQSRSLAIGTSLSIQFERLLQLGLGPHDIVGFEEQCQEIVATYSGIDLAMVVETGGHVLFDSDQAEEPVAIDGELALAIEAGAEGVVTQTLNGSMHHSAVVPALTPQGEHVASVVVSFPTHLVAERLQDMLWLNLAFSLLLLLAGVGALYLAMARFVIKPLGNLMSTVLTLREAPLHLGRRAAVESQDELGQLGTAFNGLMEELQHTTVSKSELEKAMAQLQDVSRELFEQKEHAEVTLRSIGDAVISVDATLRVQYLNPVAEQLTGWSLAEAEQRPLQEVLKLVDASSKAILPNPFNPAFIEGEASSSDVDAELLHRDGSSISVDYLAAPMHGPSGEVSGGVLTLRDVSAERRMAQRLAWEASHDALTGLVNRREFSARIEAAMETARNSKRQHVVCFLDLDRFKIVNDTAGHAAGDELLKELASVLREHIRQSDTLARLGGDEFALLLEGCSIERAQLIAADLLAAVGNFRFDAQGKMFTVGVSIGIAPVADADSCAEVLSMADTACYCAKEQGRNRVCVYRTSNSQMAARRRETDWVTRINAALAEDRFVLYHQTYLALGRQWEGHDHLEVLLRMVDEDGSLIPPGSFLPAAERYNLMPMIDRWVIKEVFSHYHELAARHGGRPLTCAINLSGTSLNAQGLFDFVREQAQEYQLPDKAICFEITETAAINNLRNAAEFVQECKSLGILFALDDFGTGTSSFGYLKSLAVDYLKIDGGFVRNMEQDGVDRAMTETIHRIGRIMGIRTVAEYAETESIITALREMGVDYAQGYGVGRPTPLFDSPSEVREAKRLAE